MQGLPKLAADDPQNEVSSNHLLLLKAAAALSFPASHR
jgi:hypothetical protein